MNIELSNILKLKKVRKNIFCETIECEILLSQG